MICLGQVSKRLFMRRWTVIGARILQGPEHHLLEVIHVDPVNKEDVGRLVGEPLAVIDDHLTAS